MTCSRTSTAGASTGVQFIFRLEREGIVKENQVLSDPVRTFAYGTDASFYRLNPKYVIKVANEDEIRRILPIARELGVPVTFRAAGTSLSGQAITDSVLLKLSHHGKNFRNYEIRNGGKEITVEPGLIGGEVNRLLARYKHMNKLPDQYKIGPDPASIESCMIGGIVNNNSSGMCCGVAMNSYHTVKDLRLVFVDGTVLDTSDAEAWRPLRRLPICSGGERARGGDRTPSSSPSSRRSSRSSAQQGTPSMRWWTPRQKT